MYVYIYIYIYIYIYTMCVCKYIYVHSGILVAKKKEWNNAICSNMDGPRGYHTKWSKSDKD